MNVLDRFRLDGKTAIVTGASSGIGQRIATAFAEVGATVFAVARRTERLTAMKDEFPSITPWPADLSDEAACERLVSDILDREERVDVLVNSAGISNIARAQDETTADLRRVMELNLVATFILSRDVGRSMIERREGGVIVNIASVTGLVGIGRPLPQGAYAASKGACINLTRELAAQWARHQIRVNALAPGWVETEMTAEWLATDLGRDTVTRLAPLGRAADVGEIATAALFLASPASSYLTGTILPVDGGWTSV